MKQHVRRLSFLGVQYTEPLYGFHALQIMRYSINMSHYHQMRAPRAPGQVHSGQGQHLQERLGIVFFFSFFKESKLSEGEAEPAASCYHM